MEKVKYISTKYCGLWWITEVHSKSLSIRLFARSTKKAADYECRQLNNK